MFNRENGTSLPTPNDAFPQQETFADECLRVANTEVTFRKFRNPGPVGDPTQWMETEPAGGLGLSTGSVEAERIDGINVPGLGIVSWTTYEKIFDVHSAVSKSKTGRIARIFSRLGIIQNS